MNVEYTETKTTTTVTKKSVTLVDLMDKVMKLVQDKLYSYTVYRDEPSLDVDEGYGCDEVTVTIYKEEVNVDEVVKDITEKVIKSITEVDEVIEVDETIEEDEGDDGIDVDEIRRERRVEELIN